MKQLLALTIGAFLLSTGCEELDLKEPGNLVPKTVDQDASLPSIFVNGTQLHSETFGTAGNTMIVVIHGGPGSDYRSLLNCSDLADEGYYVVFYDQRGSGLSKRESADWYTLESMIDDLSAVIETYRNSPDQKIVLLGHSWGAMLATAFINEHPEAIDGAILAEPGGFVWADVVDYLSRSRSFGFTSETLNDATYIDQFVTAKGIDQEAIDYKYALKVAADGAADNPSGNEGPVPFWRGGALVNRTLVKFGEEVKPDWTDNLVAFNRRVLFIYSEYNTAYGLAHAQKVSSAYADVSLQRVDDSGHEMIAFPTGWKNMYPLVINYLNEMGL
jgi:proline iminopeptidase